ncbi:5232_t:CDS:1, partial [Acaulospora morrowiae]
CKMKRVEGRNREYKEKERSTRNHRKRRNNIRNKQEMAHNKGTVEAGSRDSYPKENPEIRSAGVQQKDKNSTVHSV